MREVRRQVTVLLAAVLVSAPIVGAVDLGVDEAVGPVDAVPSAGHGDDHPPIRIHGDEQFLLPSSGVTGGSGTAEDPYVISGWTVRPLSVRGLQAKIDAFGRKCKPTPPVSASPWAPLLLHGIEIVDTSKHVIIENVTVVPREPEDIQDPGGAVDSKHMIGILLRDADHVTIRNVTVGQADGPRLYRGICAKRSDNLVIEDTLVQRTINDGVEVADADDVAVERSVVRDSAGAASTTVRGLEAESVTGLVILGTRVSNHPSTSLYAVWTPDAVIESNTVTGGWYGVELFESDGSVVRSNVLASNVKHGLWIGDSPGVEVHQNNIEDNGGDGLQARGNLVDATHNWWGCPDGPDDAACDDVDGDVTYDPWLESPNPDAGA